MGVARIALLTEIPAPFRIPLFNALANEPDVELRVLFLSKRDPKHPYPVYADEFRFNSRTLPGRDLIRNARWVVLNRGVFAELVRFRPDAVIVGGWNQPAFWQAALYTRLCRRPLIGWVESTARDARPASTWLGRVKRMLIGGCTGFLVPGSASREYLRALGVSDEQIVAAPNAVDLEIFGNRVVRLRSERDRLRVELGLSGVVLLYVGRLDPEKGVDTLLEAVEGLPVTTVVVGQGSDEARLRSLASAGVRFTGRLERDELVRWYAAADAFVLPSRSDQWGMVLNEAAAAGLPLVSTEAPGAAHDLIEQGVNGFRVPTGDALALAEALRRVAEDPAWRAAAGARSAELGGRFTPEAWSAAVVGLVGRLIAV